MPKIRFGTSWQSEILPTALTSHVSSKSFTQNINFTFFSCLAEKPDARYLVLGVQISPYGCPPELIDLSWKASPSNGELSEYNVWYEIGDHVCPAVSHMKRASWCTRHSSSSDASFSCDLKRIVNRSNDQKVCLEYRYPLCWSISVTNRFGTASLSFPYVTHFYIDSKLMISQNILPHIVLTISPEGLVYVVTLIAEINTDKLKSELCKGGASKHPD